MSFKKIIKVKLGFSRHRNKTDREYLRALKIFGLLRKDIRWRKLQNQVLHNELFTIHHK
jgi:hypothetical protein